MVAPRIVISVALLATGRRQPVILPFDSITVADKQLGKGRFGVVRSGVYTAASNVGVSASQRVAVKMLHQGLATADVEAQHIDMDREASNDVEPCPRLLPTLKCYCCLITPLPVLCNC